MLRWIAALALVTWSSASFAEGVRFDIVAQAPGYTYKGRMSIDGDRARIDITEGNHPLFNPNISIITREAGMKVLVIDHDSRTYFQRYVPHIAGPLAAGRGMGKSEVTRMRVDSTRDRLADGTERHIIRADYTLRMEVSGEELDAVVTMDAEVIIDPRIRQHAHPWGLQYGAKTGFERLDRSLARAIPDRLPLRQVITFSRRIADGPLITDTLTIDVTNIAAADIPRGEFYAPDGYAYREPVFLMGSVLPFSLFSTFGRKKGKGKD